jgi:hypothetical protein
MFAIGFVLGAVRALLLAPAIGVLAATMAELPVMLGLSWVVCGWIVRWLRVPPRAVIRMAMGATALGVLLACELMLGLVVFGRSAAQLAASLATLPGLLGLSAQLLFAAFPLLQARRDPV